MQANLGQLQNVHWTYVGRSHNRNDALEILFLRPFFSLDVKNLIS
jgi:hypothetical protein